MKVGDTVITNAFTTALTTTKATWLPEHAALVGKKGKIEEAFGGNFRVHGFIWPIESLTLATDEPEPKKDNAYSGEWKPAGNTNAYHKTYGKVKILSAGRGKAWVLLADDSDILVSQEELSEKPFCLYPIEWLNKEGRDQKAAETEVEWIASLIEDYITYRESFT